MAHVRLACAEFLEATSQFYKVSDCDVRVLASETATSAGTLDERTLRRLQPRDHADSCVDADGGAQGSHVIRYVPEYPVPRVLPPPRLPAVRVCGFMALAGLLRKGRRAYHYARGTP